jgi:hypothetical protein
MWQDIIFTVANILFAYALVPQVYHGFKNKKAAMILQTAFLTTIGLTASSIAFFSLSLFFSGIVSGFNALMWLFLLIQRVIYH